MDKDMKWTNHIQNQLLNKVPKYLTEQKDVRNMGIPTNCALFSLFHRTFASYYQSIPKHDKNQLSTTFRIAKPIATNLFSSMAVARKTPAPQTWLSMTL